jgi:thioredoxin reductase
VSYDVVIAGGGPAGLSAALALGRARKRVLVCDSGPRRNAAAAHIHNFVTRDGTPPDEFRRIGREQLATYPNVEVEDTRVHAIAGSRGAFRVTVDAGVLDARRILLCTGMIDDMVAIEGFRELWGHSIVQCPYCHGWEARDQRWGYLALPHNTAHLVMFAQQLRGWTRDVTVFTQGLPLEPLPAHIRIETAPIQRLVAGAVELATGRVPIDLLFAHPPQHHVALVTELGLALDDDGMVKVDPMKRETSVPGVYASGDLTTRAQGALFAAAAGTHAATVMNFDLTIEQPL